MALRIARTLLSPTAQLLIGNAHQECFPHDGTYIPQLGDWWVAYEGKQVAGFAGISPSDTMEDTGYLCRAGVLPSFRGAGLQKRLIRIRLAAARRHRWGTVITDTRQNPASANSLIACGFRLFEPPEPWGFSDSLYWRITL